MLHAAKFWLRLALSLVFFPFCTIHPAAADPGDLDLAFGTGGTIVMDVGGDNLGDNARDVALQSDGRIVVAGDSGYTVARFNENGTPDTSFGGTGFVGISFATVHVSAEAVALQPDGKIVVVGRATGPVVVRLNPDGSLDTTFDGDGVADINATGLTAYSLAIQSDGKILVGGMDASAVPALARLNIDGTMDTGFGTNNTGIVTVASVSNSNWGFQGLAIQADGRIVGVSSGTVGTSTNVFVVVRLNADGSPDTTFDTDGLATTAAIGVNGVASAAALRRDGKIVVGGYGHANGSGFYRELILVRFTADGLIDATFGSNGDGVVATSIGPEDDELYDLILDSQERILIAGQSEGYPTNSSTRVLSARYTADGVLDTSFKMNDVVVGDGTTAWALALQADGKVVIGGYRGEPQRQFLMQRFLGTAASADGSNESSGGGGGGSMDAFLLVFAVVILTFAGGRRRQSR